MKLKNYNYRFKSKPACYIKLKKSPFNVVEMYTDSYHNDINP